MARNRLHRTGIRRFCRGLQFWMVYFDFFKVFFCELQDYGVGLRKTSGGFLHTTRRLRMSSAVFANDKTTVYGQWCFYKRQDNCVRPVVFLQMTRQLCTTSGVFSKRQDNCVRPVVFFSCNNPNINICTNNLAKPIKGHILTLY